MINTMRRFIDHRKHRNDTEMPRAVYTLYMFYTDKKFTDKRFDSIQCAR